MSDDLQLQKVNVLTTLAFLFRHEELRLRDCISHLKTVRASIQLTVLDVESVKRSGIDKGLAKDMVGQVR